MIIAFGLVSLTVSAASYDYLTLNVLFEKTRNIRIIVDQYQVLAPLLYMLGYALIVMFSVPAASLLTIVSGYVFGGFWGGIIAFSGALVGASALFLIVRAGFTLKIEGTLKSKTAFAGLSEELSSNQFRYLLFLRFFPIFPFWMVNLAPAILGVKFRTFFFTTGLGIIPGTFIIAGIGEKMRIISAPRAELFYELISNSQFIFLSLVLSAITLCPVVVKLVRLKKESRVKHYK